MSEITAYYDDLVEADGSFEIDLCRIDLTANMDGQCMSARVCLRLNTLRPISVLKFNLARTLNVVMVKGEPEVSGWHQTANVVVVELRHTTTPRQRVTLAFGYRGSIRIRSSFDAILSAIDSSGAILTEWWFPWLRDSGPL